MNISHPKFFVLCRAAVVAALLFLAGCGEDTTSSDTTSSPVTLSTPSDWTRRNNYPIATGVAADYILQAPPVNGYMANVLVLSGARPSMELDQAVQMEIEGNLAKIPSYTVDSTITRVVSGFDSRIIEAHYNVNGFYLTQREVLVMSTSKVIVIAFSRVVTDTTYASTLRSLEASISIR